MSTAAGIRPVRAARVHRFSATERVLHAAHGTAFVLMLLSGLVLYLPFLAQAFGNRPVVKAFHLAVAALWLTALVLIAVVGDRAVLRRTRRQFESLDREDLRWLRSRAARSAPQGRFNGGMKVHAIVQAALTVLFFVSGALMWLGERNTSFRLPGTIATHDLAMFAGAIFVIGHVAIAFSQTASPSLSGIVDGTVPTDYAARHHAAWDPATEPVERVRPLSR
ncbi:MAG: cytochrome b/b6 domain-containing protein, partial [Patulibacter sp.]|nr:cytochrome b/b6 domain-containing protein [Patulibacter sp.]